MDQVIRIACPRCEWEPDGESYWECTCGYNWNTFETRAKCPNCGIQWTDTWCPACGNSSKHENWYISNETKEENLSPLKATLKNRKTKVEDALIAYGIKNRRISYLPYLTFLEDDFQDTYEVGCRILILWAVSYLSHNLDESDEIESWLRLTGLWDRVSDNEKQLFIRNASRDEIVRFSWQIEAVIVLCWAVNLLDYLPQLDTELTDDELDELINRLPINQDPTVFLNTLSYRDKEDIFIENIVNEMITGYLRDQLFTERKEGLNINTSISFERHRALNWLRQFSGIDEWDETDTST